MPGLRSKWIGIIVPFLVFVAVLTIGVWRYGYSQALDQLARRGTADITLVLDGLSSDLQRYRDQAVQLAEHPTLTQLTATRQRDQAADDLLLAAADRTGAAMLLFVDSNGTVLANSQEQQPAGLQQSRYFQRAMDGALGIAHATDTGFGKRVFYFAAPSFADTGQIQAALVTVADVENAEIGWRAGPTAVLLIDSDDNIFMSNRTELLGWAHPAGSTTFLHPNGEKHVFKPQSFGNHEVWKLNLGPYLPSEALRLTQSRPQLDMTGLALVDVAPAQKIALLQSTVVGALLLFFGALLFLTQVRRQTLSIANAKLESRVAERTQSLTETNKILRHEIRERKEAEAALKKAQADLVQAGKLSALGQLSAGISHELNQPLMAIQQYAANGGAFLERKQPDKAGENLSRIDEMARRMGRIIRNLRAFVRNENEPVGQVDIVPVIETALDLTGARMRQSGITVNWQPPPHPVWVSGGEVRLGQVLVNLISNAADAMTDSPVKQLDIMVQEGNPVVLRLRDTGPGIEEPEKIFDPFYSTKQVGDGDGMGLGLSISYGLVQSFGGNIRGINTANGAEFSVELERWQEKDKVA